jgi:AcrR family transcriptional regulator
MPQPFPPADVPRAGLRERKKLKTRLAIQEHALRLFRDQGYEKTTVEQIAEAAEVSPSTFFRYFPTKEDVVLFDALDPLLIESFRRQPPGLSPIGALRAAMHEVFATMAPDVIAEQTERGRLVYQVPALQTAWIADLLRTVRLMQGLLAERLGRDADDPRVRAYTGAIMGVLMASMIPILTQPDSDFVGELDAALDFLEGGLRI